MKKFIQNLSMFKLNLKKDTALKWHLSFLAIIFLISIISMITNFRYTHFVLTSLMAAIFFIVSRLIFGKHKFTQNLITPIVCIALFEITIPKIQNLWDPSIINITKSIPALIIIYILDFLTDESLAVIETIEEKFEVKKN
jgi:hypothetical protein